MMLGFRRELPSLCGVTPDEMDRVNRSVLAASVRWLKRLMRTG